LVAAVYRKAAEVRVKKSLFQKIMAHFRKNWPSFIIVEVDNRLNETIHKVIANHNLRGLMPSTLPRLSPSVQLSQMISFCLL